MAGTKRSFRDDDIHSCERNKKFRSTVFPLLDLPPELLTRVFEAVGRVNPCNSTLVLTRLHVTEAMAPLITICRYATPYALLAKSAVLPLYPSSATLILARFLSPWHSFSLKIAPKSLGETIYDTLQYGFGGFEGVPADVARRLLRGRPFADPDYREKRVKPTARELVEMAEAYPGSTLSGHVNPEETCGSGADVRFNEIRLRRIKPAEQRLLFEKLLQSGFEAAITYSEQVLDRYGDMIQCTCDLSFS